MIQLRNVGTEGFEARFREWVYIDFLHRFPESFPYLVVPAGRRELADGTIIEAGRFPISGTGVDNDVTFGEAFPGKPALFLTTQTQNNAQPISVRSRNVTAEGFSALAFEEEQFMNGHGEETGHDEEEGH